MSEKDWAVNEAANLVATGIECFTELDGTATARANLNIVADTLRRIYARGRVAGLREAAGIGRPVVSDWSSSLLRLHLGECTSQELRTARAMLEMVLGEISSAADKLEAEKP